MQSINTNCKGAMLKAVFMLIGAVATALGSVGCDDYSDMIMDSYYYQQDVFDTANDNFIDYIRM